MSITNLEQIRAARAIGDAEHILSKRGSGSDQVSGYHSLIITNGLLATLAYSYAKGAEYECIATALLGHLSYFQRMHLLPGEPLSGSLMEQIDQIAVNATSDELSMYTEECLAYLNYLKRFSRAKTKKDLKENA